MQYILINKTFFIVLFFSIAKLGFSQEGISNEVFRQIDKEGYNFVLPVVKGDIEDLKNTTPPVDTWTYQDLLEYKETLKDKKLHYGSFIQPAGSDNEYAFNFFAFTPNGDGSYKYFFVAIVVYRIEEEHLTNIESYLFTQEKPLKSWWTIAYNYYESDAIKTIPSAFVDYPPPPPPE